MPLALCLLASVMALIAATLLVPATAHATISGANAYPNPVTPNGDGWADTGYINFSLATASTVTVKIYDADWRLMSVLSDRRPMGAGFHSVRFPATDADGSLLPDGVYWFSIQTISPTGSLLVARGGQVFVGSGIRKVKPLPGSAPQFRAAYVHPNPGTSDSPAAVMYRMSTDAFVTLKVYNYRGEVRTVLDNVRRGAGGHAEVWDGRDRYGGMLPDGNYRYMLFATSGGDRPYTHLRSGVISLSRGLSSTWRTYPEIDRWAVTTGPWTYHQSSVYMDGGYLYTSSEGATYNVNFRGTAFEWLGPKGPQMGRARVFVDGVSRGVVDLRTSTFQPRETLWSVSGLDPGRPHAITIKLIGGAQESHAGYMGVDAFRVYGFGVMPGAPRGDAVFGRSWQEFLVVDKSDRTLYQFKGGVLVASYPVAIGRSNAETPVATWRIMSKYHTTATGVYGPRKMRLYRQAGPASAPRYQYTAYNIHGTNQPSSIGTKASAGCIRLYNEQILRLFPTVPLGTYVVTQE